MWCPSTSRACEGTADNHKRTLMPRLNKYGAKRLAELCPPLCSQVFKILVNNFYMNVQVCHTQSLLREDIQKSTFIFLKLPLWQLIRSLLGDVPVPWEEYLPIYAACVIWTTIKNPIFRFYPLPKELNRQPQSAADQIMPVRSEEKRVLPPLFELASLWWVTRKSCDRLRSCAWCVLMNA